MDQIQKTDAKVIQEDAAQPEVEFDAVNNSSDLSVKANGLQKSLDTVADGLSVRGFKCAKCGLAHMHDTNKHRATDSFDMGDSEAADMEFNPNCHCGVQALARNGSDYGVDERSAATTARSAPVPDEATRELNAKFGSL